MALFTLLAPHPPEVYVRSPQRLEKGLERRVIHFFPWPQKSSPRLILGGRPCKERAPPSVALQPCLGVGNFQSVTA